MTQRQFYNWQTAGGGGDVARLVETLERREIPWCMIGGLAVNHWAEEPMATADVDLVITTDRIEEAVQALIEAGFKAERHDRSINFKGQSKVSVQINTEKFYHDFPARALAADVHGILMRVACLEDTCQGKLKAYQDADRRPTKRRKDLLDLARLVESHPELLQKLPPDVQAKLRD
jgi:hypothetical protein